MRHSQTVVNSCDMVVIQVQWDTRCCTKLSLLGRCAFRHVRCFPARFIHGVVIIVVYASLLDIFPISVWLVGTATCYMLIFNISHAQVLQASLTGSVARVSGCLFVIRPTIRTVDLMQFVTPFSVTHEYC